MILGNLQFIIDEINRVRQAYVHGILYQYGDIKQIDEGVDATKCGLKVDQNTGMEKF